MLRLCHRVREDPEGPEEVAKRLRDLVLLPGFMCDEDLWTDMARISQKLGTVHYGNVYEDDTLEGMARRVLDGSPKRFVLIGFSMGGFVSRVLSLTAPERVTGVAFVASSARGYSVEETERRKKGYGPRSRPPRAASARPRPASRPRARSGAARAAARHAAAARAARCAPAKRRWCERDGYADLARIACPFAGHRLPPGSAA